MRRPITILLALLIAACAKFNLCAASPEDDSTKSSSDDVKLTKEFMERVKKNIAYRAGSIEAVPEQVAREHVDSQALLRGSIHLLERGSPEEKRKAAHFLGRLQNPSAIKALVKTLAETDENLRESACYALQWLHAKGEPAESALVKLRRNDPSADVRVAAALALRRPRDEDAVSAFKLGLKSTKDVWIRESCEEELEKIGKLELPLPEHVYTEISREEYERIKGDRRSYTIRREIKKGGTTFFEAVERHIEAPQFPHWYQVKIGAADADKKGKTK